MTDANTKESIEYQLKSLLQKRSLIVADTNLRNNAPEEHLNQLRACSEELFETHRAGELHLSPRLNHFLHNGSYGKALDYLENQP